MKKQDTILHHLVKAILILLALVVLETSVVAKQGQVLLNAKGEPFSDEVLMLLSSSPGELKKRSTQKTSTQHAHPLSFNKKQRKVKVYNPELEQELLYYLKLGQISKVEALLAKGVKPVYKNNRGETPLGIAVVRGWASMVINLVKHGADINERGTRGLTLLHIATAHGLKDVAKTLVRNGLSPMLRTDKDWTALHVAARYGHSDLVQYYLDLGVNPNIRNTDGNTALGLAHHLHHQRAIKMLAPVTRVKSMPFKKKGSTRKYKRLQKRDITNLLRRL